VFLVAYDKDVQKHHRSRTAKRELTLVLAYLVFGTIDNDAPSICKSNRALDRHEEKSFFSSSGQLVRTLPKTTTDDSWCARTAGFGNLTSSYQS
jgi:hypothetical protein